MDLRTPLMAHFEPAKAIEPGVRALDHPPIAPQSFTRLDATPSDARDARDDAPLAQRPTAACVIIPLIGMQLHGPLAWPYTSLSSQSQRRDGVNSFFEPLRIVDIGPRNGHRQRHTLTVDHDMALCAQLATIRRILASLFAPWSGHTAAIE